MRNFHRAINGELHIYTSPSLVAASWERRGGERRGGEQRGG